MKKFSLISLRLILAFGEKVLLANLTTSIQPGGRFSLRCPGPSTTLMHLCFPYTWTPGDHPRKCWVYQRWASGLAKTGFPLAGYCQVCRHFILAVEEMLTLRSTLDRKLEVGRACSGKGNRHD